MSVALATTLYAGLILAACYAWARFLQHFIDEQEKDHARRRQDLERRREDIKRRQDEFDRRMAGRN